MGLRNRWMDKPCQFVVTDDGAAGFVGEHSVMDGTPTAYLCDAVLDAIAAPHFATGTTSAGGSASLPAPVALDWNVSDATRAAIRTAAHAAHALASGQALNIVRTPYGKAAIKAFRVSPDSWAQLLVQLAYARLLRARGERRVGGTYEAAAARRFLKGRTEAVRVVSAEADAWVESMDDPGVRVEERGRLFARAVETHVARARRAGNGLGIDRHLLGEYGLSTGCSSFISFELMASSVQACGSPSGRASRSRKCSRTRSCSARVRGCSAPPRCSRSISGRMAGARSSRTGSASRTSPASTVSSPLPPSLSVRCRADGGALQTSCSIRSRRGRICPMRSSVLRSSVRRRICMTCMLRLRGCRMSRRACERAVLPWTHSRGSR